MSTPRHTPLPQHPGRRHPHLALGVALAGAVLGSLAFWGGLTAGLADASDDTLETASASTAPKTTSAPAVSTADDDGDAACEAELRREFAAGNASPDLPACAAVGKERATDILNRISPELIASAAGGSDGGNDSQVEAAASEPASTVAQRQALESAQSYIDLSGFSKKGLLRQLTSEAGEGFTKSDAQWAVARIKVDWNDEAVESAQSYMEMGGFSRAGLIRQLSSSAGEQFTKAQATHAADQVGL